MKAKLPLGQENNPSLHQIVEACATRVRAVRMPAFGLRDRPKTGKFRAGIQEPSRPISGPDTGRVDAKRMISRLVLKYRKGERLVMRRAHETALPRARRFPLTMPF